MSHSVNLTNISVIFIDKSVMLIKKKLLVDLSKKKIICWIQLKNFETLTKYFGKSKKLLN